MPSKASTLSFTSPSKPENPFFFNGTGTTAASSWTFDAGLPPETDWGGSCGINDAPCVLYQNPNAVTIRSATGTDTTWTSAASNNGIGYSVSFTALFDATENATASFQFGAQDPIQINTVTATTYTGYLQNGESLSFIINATNDGFGDITISNFSAAVPGPLPAAGAATAFGFSRRLRRRIHGVQPLSSRKPATPAHPAAYLNLSPAALQSAPLSFNYFEMATRSGSESSRHDHPLHSLPSPASLASPRNQVPVIVEPDVSPAKHAC